MNCPYCEDEIRVDDTLNFDEIDDMNIVITRAGFCPNCQRTFIWYEDYQYCTTYGLEQTDWDEN